MNILYVGILGAAVVIFLSSLNWQRSVKTVLVLVVVEGALRKWVLPQASQLLYFLKDFILIGAYLSYFLRLRHSIPPMPGEKSIKALAYLASAWCLFQAFNPSLGSPIIGLFGLKNYLLYIPLMWLLPALFRSEVALFKFLRTYLVLLIPVALLAIAQYFSPPTSPLNVYANDLENGIAVSGGAVRVTGTFSYLAGYTVYLSICFSLLLPILNQRQTAFWQGLTLIEISLVAITSFMTGSRGVMITLVLILVGYFCFQGVTEFSNFLRSLQKLFLPAIVAFILIVFKFRDSVDSFWVRGSRSYDVLPRIISSFTEPFTNFQYKGFDGYGTGATFQANSILRSILDLPPGETIPIGYESEMGRIALDLGPIGFLTWYGLKIMLIIAIWKVYRKLKMPFLQHLALSAFILQSITINSQLVYNHTAGLYHWLFNSFIFLLPSLEKIEHWKSCQTIVLSDESLTHFLNSPHR